MGTETLRIAPVEESREKLRELFTKQSRALYEYALEKTGSHERAKQVLEQTLREAVRTPSLCMSRPNFLFELCDHIALTSRPAHMILEQMERTLDLPAEPSVKAQAPVGAVRRVRAKPQSSSGYDLDQDEWIKKLRESRKSRAAMQPAAGSETRPASHTAPVPGRSKEQEPGQEQELEELFDEMEDQRVSVAGKILTWICALIVAALLWCVIGLMMNTRLIPWVDLGYSWFNTHIYDMF
ncbi:MAG: hypothetical protein AAGU74_06395 [Bacillota bacterium]